MDESEIWSTQARNAQRKLSAVIEYDKFDVECIVRNREARLEAHRSRQTNIEESTARRIVDAYIIYAATGRASECTCSRPERDYIGVSLPELLEIFVDCSREKAIEYSKAILIASRMQYKPSHFLNEMEFFDWDIEEWAHQQDD